MRPVDLAPGSLDSHSLLLVVGLVVPGEHGDLSASIERHDAATVAHIDHICHIIDDHHNSGAGTRPLWTHLLVGHLLLGAVLCRLHQVKKVSLALFEPRYDGLLRELGEVLILHYKVVQVVSQVVSTRCPSMPIKDSKEADLRPLDREMLLRLGLEDVQYDGYSVLIIVTNNTLVGIGSIGLDDTTLFL